MRTQRPAAVRPPPRGQGIPVLPLGFAAILLAGLAPTAPAAECPPSIVHAERYTSSPPFPTGAFVYDSTLTHSPSYAHVRFDRTVGRMEFAATSGGRLRASVRVIETFALVGVPFGTPVDATIDFRVDGFSQQDCGGSGCGILFEASLTAGADSTVADANHYGPTIGPRWLATTLSRPVRFIAGVPLEVQFSLAYGTGPGGGGHAEAVGRYGVSGLPTDARAIACSGADLTPAQTATWGSLKTRYR